MKNFARAGASIALIALIFGAGCEAPNWDDPAYVAGQIQNGDAHERKMALENLGRMTIEQQKQAVPALVTVYNDAGPNQKAAMGLLVQIRDERAKDAYLAEMKTNAGGFSGAAAETLGEIQAKDAIPAMLEFLKTTDSTDAKIGIIQSFKHMPDKQLVAPLVELLKLDPDNFPISIHAYSCEVLGEIALAIPDAIDDAAIKQITLSVFYANNRNQNVDSECGLAIQQIGKRAIPSLLSMYKGERKDIGKLMLRYDTPQSPFPVNHPKLIAARRLASLRAGEAVAPILADMNSVKEAPKSLSGNAAVSWRVKEGQVTSESIYALGDIGDMEAAPTLRKILVNDKEIQTKWDDITDGMVELQLRQDAASALNRLGDRGALDALLEMTEKGVIIDFEKRAAMLDKKGAAVKEVERYQFNWMCANEYANLATGDKLEAYRKVVEGYGKKYPELAKKLASFVPLIELAGTCEKAGDAAAQGACYAAKLSDPTPEIRAKAAWEIGRLPPEVSSVILADSLKTDFLDTREILTFGLYRAPTKAGAAAVEALLKKEGKKSGIAYKLDHRRLRLLLAYLKENGKN